MNIIARNVRATVTTLVKEGDRKHVRIEFDMYRLGGDEALIAKGARMHMEVGTEHGREFAELFGKEYHVSAKEMREVRTAVKA